MELKPNALWGALVVLAMAVGLADGAQAADGREIEAMAAKAVATVGEVWVRDQRYEAFQKELSGKYSGTPDQADFMANEQWVVVYSSKSAVYPGIYKARGKTAMNLQVGDIVEMKIGNFRKASTYQELSEITRVLCKQGTAEYSDCVRDNPMSWYDKDGGKLTQPR